MRCPKCGFISFDHLSSCAKCGRDISETASELQGTSIKVESPMFLGGALATLAGQEDSFEEHAMDAEIDTGIDFAMEIEGEGEEPQITDAATADIDFSDAEGRETAKAEAVEERADTALEADVEEQSSDEKSEDVFEEIDFAGQADEEEGGLEFDLEDFIDDFNEDKAEK